MIKKPKKSYASTKAIQVGSTRPRREDEDEITAVTKVYEQTGDKLNESQETIREIAELADKLKQLVETEEKPGGNK